VPGKRSNEKSHQVASTMIWISQIFKEKWVYKITTKEKWKYTRTYFRTKLAADKNGED